jgi:hypothetical protein
VLYHGTTQLNARRIEKDGFHVPMLDILNVERNKRNWNKSIGSLGYGLYTFENDPQLAYEFASKFDPKNPVVFELPNIIPEKNLLDLTDPDTNLLFRKFCEDERNSKHGERIYDHVRHRGKVKSYAGVMTELFIIFLKKKYKITTLGVKRWTETDLPGVRYGVGANGIEVTVRNAQLINMGKINILRREDIYGS